MQQSTVIKPCINTWLSYEEMNENCHCSSCQNEYQLRDYYFKKLGIDIKNISRTFTEAKKNGDKYYYSPNNLCVESHKSVKNKKGECLECKRILNINKEIKKKRKESFYRDLPKTKEEAITGGFDYFFPESECEKGHIDAFKAKGKGNQCVVCLKIKDNRKIFKYKVLPKTQEEAIKLNVDFFYDEKPCIYGHVEKKRTKGKECVACRKVSREKYKTKDIARSSDLARSSLYRTILAIQKGIDQDYRKDGTSEFALGYSLIDFKKNMESKFIEGMSWENHGEWHVDHKKSVSQFIKEGEHRVSIINSLDNLFPMWSKDNLNKKDKDFYDWFNASAPETKIMYKHMY